MGSSFGREPAGTGDHSALFWKHQLTVQHQPDRCKAGEEISVHQQESHIPDRVQDLPQDNSRKEPPVQPQPAQ